MSELKIVFLGDIMGKIGRNGVKEAIPEIKKKYNPDLIIANAENLAHGKGVSEKTLTEMMDAGIDFFTSGNHIWKNKDGEQVLRENKFPIIRPANYPAGVPGDGSKVIEIGTKKILIVNLMGRVFFFKEAFECPFRTLENILEEHKNTDLSAIFVDFHAEATSEKNAFPRYFHGKVSTVLGTHTHVQTADEQILEKGTSFVSDAGMCGLKDSSLGVDLKNVYETFLTQIPREHVIPEHGICQINGIFVIIKPENKTTQKIERIQFDVEV